MPKNTVIFCCMIVFSAVFGSLTVSTIDVDENYDVVYEDYESTSRFRRDAPRKEHIIWRDNQETSKLVSNNGTPTVKRVIYHGIYPSLEIEQPVVGYGNRNHQGGNSNKTRHSIGDALNSNRKPVFESKRFERSVADDEQYRRYRTNADEVDERKYPSIPVRITYQAVYPPVVQSSSGGRSYVRAPHPPNGTNVDYYTRQRVVPLNSSRAERKNGTQPRYRTLYFPDNNQTNYLGDPENKGRVRLVSAAYYNVNGSRDDLRSFSNPTAHSRRLHGLANSDRLQHRRDIIESTTTNGFEPITTSYSRRHRRENPDTSKPIKQQSHRAKRSMDQISVDALHSHSNRRADVFDVQSLNWELTEIQETTDHAPGGSKLLKQQNQFSPVDAPLLNLALADADLQSGRDISGNRKESRISTKTKSLQDSNVGAPKTLQNQPSSDTVDISPLQNQASYIVNDQNEDQDPADVNNDPEAENLKLNGMRRLQKRSRLDFDYSQKSQYKKRSKRPGFKTRNEATTPNGGYANMDDLPESQIRASSVGNHRAKNWEDESVATNYHRDKKWERRKRLKVRHARESLDQEIQATHQLEKSQRTSPNIQNAVGRRKTRKTAKVKQYERTSVVRRRRDTTESWNWLENIFLSLGIGTAKVIVQQGTEMDNVVDDSDDVKNEISDADDQMSFPYTTDNTMVTPTETRRSLSSELTSGKNNVEEPSTRPVLIVVPPRRLRCRPRTRYARGKCRPVL